MKNSCKPHCYHGRRQKHCPELGKRSSRSDKCLIILSTLLVPLTHLMPSKPYNGIYTTSSLYLLLSLPSPISASHPHSSLYHSNASLQCIPVPCTLPVPPIPPPPMPLLNPMPNTPHSASHSPVPHSSITLPLPSAPLLYYLSTLQCPTPVPLSSPTPLLPAYAPVPQSPTPVLHTPSVTSTIPMPHSPVSHSSITLPLSSAPLLYYPLTPQCPTPLLLAYSPVFHTPSVASTIPMPPKTCNHLTNC